MKEHAPHCICFHRNSLFLWYLTQTAWEEQRRTDPQLLRFYLKHESKRGSRQQLLDGWTSLPCFGSSGDLWELRVFSSTFQLQFHILLPVTWEGGAWTARVLHGSIHMAALQGSSMVTYDPVTAMFYWDYFGLLTVYPASSVFSFIYILHYTQGEFFTVISTQSLFLLQQVTHLCHI